MTGDLQICARSCCSNPVIPSGRGSPHPKIYCSDRCARRAAWARQQKRKGEERRADRKAYRGICRREGCGKPTQAASHMGPITAYCSAACRHKHAKRDRPPKPPKPNRIKICLYCENEFEVSPGGAGKLRAIQAKFCCEEHKELQRRRDEGVRYRDQYLADIAASSQAARPVFTCSLEGCAATFSSRVGDGQRPRWYCSSEHYAEDRRLQGVMWTPPSELAERDSRNGMRRVKAAGFGAPIEVFSNLEILERDRWICQRCGCKTPQHLRGSKAQNAPEVDHKIPVIRGGGHTRENCWCLCHQCNHAKGDKLIEELSPQAQQPSLLDSIDGGSDSGPIAQAIQSPG